MRRLLLMRHAKTAKQSPSGRDRDRALEPRGHVDARIVGDYLQQHGMVPDLALVSTAVRTRQTWDYVSAAWPAVEVDLQDDLYGADPAELLRAVRTAAGHNPKRLMVIAHNPGLHEFALALTASVHTKNGVALAEHLPTGAVAVLDFAIDNWSNVSFRRGRLEEFITPKLLKEES